MKNRGDCRIKKMEKRGLVRGFPGGDWVVERRHLGRKVVGLVREENQKGVAWVRSVVSICWKIWRWGFRRRSCGEVLEESGVIFAF